MERQSAKKFCILHYYIIKYFRKCNNNNNNNIYLYSNIYIIARYKSSRQHGIHIGYTMQIKISMKWPAHSYEISITKTSWL